MTRTPQDPADGAPRRRRAARASVPGGAGSATAPQADPAGKTPQAQALPAPAPEVTPGPETRRPGPASVRAGDQAPAGSATDPGEAASADPAGSIPSTEPGEGARGGGQEPGRGGGTLRPGQGEPRTWTIALPAGLEMLSLNDRLHWRERHKRGEVIRNAACWAARAAKVPQLPRAGVVIEYQPPDRRHRDADNPVAAAKAAIDGLVIARCLPDDECPRYVTGIYCTIGEVYPEGRLVLHLTEVAP